MTLTTAEKFFLLTERIGKKPVLRTRFTTQAYFVLAVVLDLVTQGVLAISHERLTVADSKKLAAQPTYVTVLRERLQANAGQDETLEADLKFVTSWNVANALYDGIGGGLLKQGLTEKKIFQNNLIPKVIYLPLDASRAQVLADFKADIFSDAPAVTTRNLYALLEQQDVLKYLFSSSELVKLTAAFEREVATDSRYQETQRLTAMAGHIIQMKKFEMDGWLS
ncbi:hypothetical protein [Levilactobacillus tongjiangensis]|uniref:Uncharacterized protein n=1 Tax=Levilactobacillus tongjiangensis TaxID=2486023 RepID=A0ABW1SP93_9LACO|nr:hypothetical protein [Levilactobacillus tongjiangensis]